MRFPLRFTSDFQLGVIARGMQLRGQLPMVIRLAPYTEGSLGVGALPAVEALPRIVWIGDAEPLDHPEIPEYVNAATDSGRDVFLHTDGKVLRRRIHEFRPSPRLWFVFRFDAEPAVDDGAILEAIRVAKLSGFLVVGLTLLAGPRDLEPLARVHSRLRVLDLDGAMIVPIHEDAGREGALKASWRKLLSAPWPALSRMFAGLGIDTVGVFPGRAIRISESLEARPENCEEGAQA